MYADDFRQAIINLNVDSIARHNAFWILLSLKVRRGTIAKSAVAPDHCGHALAGDNCSPSRSSVYFPCQCVRVFITICSLGMGTHVIAPLSFSTSPARDLFWCEFLWQSGSF